MYEDETGTPLLTGSMALLDDTNTTGFYSEQITLSAANGFEYGKSYCIRVTIVVGGVTGVLLHTFKMGARVDTRLVSGTAQTAGDIIGDTNDIQARLPAALVSGRIDASVGAMAANVLTDTAINADAITAAKVAADVSAEIADAVWDEDATGHQTQGTFGQAIGDPVADTNTIFKAVVTDAAGATVGVDVVAVQADTDNIQTRLPAALTAGGKIPASADEILGVAQSATDLKDFADDGYDPITNKVQGVVLVDTLTTYTGNTPQTGDSFARLGVPAGVSVSADIAAIEAQTDDIGVAGAGLTALGDTRIANLDATVSSRATQTSVDTIDDFLDTEIAAIKTKTDQLNFTGTDVKATLDGETVALTAGQITVKKNVALANFMFKMVLSSDHVTAGTGLTVTCQRSIDGAAFANCATSTATEISAGWYKVNLAASDLNGDTIALKFTAPTADQRDVLIATQA